MFFCTRKPPQEQLRAFRQWKANKSFALMRSFSFYFRKNQWIRCRSCKLCAARIFNGNWKIRAHSSCSLGIAFNFYHVNKNKWFIVSMEWESDREKRGKQVHRRRGRERGRPRQRAMQKSERRGKRSAERTTRKSLIFYSFNFLRVRINVTIISMEQRYTLTLSAVHI